MAFSKITRQRMLDWITECATAPKPMPSDQEIVDRLGLTSVENARALLADLADARQITVDWNAEPRRVTLGAKKPTALVPAKPLAPTVKSPDARRAAAVPPDRRETIRAIAEKTARRSKPAAAVPVVADAPVQPAPAPPETTFAPGAKPRISAAVIRAARRDDIPLDRFVTMLIERGFASYEADAARERAA